MINRSDLHAVVERINGGANIEEIAEEHGVEVVKYHRGLQFLIGLKDRHRDPNVEPEIRIYWGESGTGKTRKAIEEFPDAYILTKPNKDGNVWFDNYRGQKTVIIDEFYGWIPYDMLLRMCDRYPLQVPFKGGFVKFQATRTIFTSNKPWKEWYPNIDDTSAFERRIREFGTITEFKKLVDRDVT